MSSIQNSVEAAQTMSQSGQDDVDNKCESDSDANNDEGNLSNDEPVHSDASSEADSTAMVENSDASSPPPLLNTEGSSPNSSGRSPSLLNLYLLDANKALDAIMEEDKRLTLKFRKINKMNQLIRLVEVIDAQKDFCDCLNIYIVEYYRKKNRCLTPILPSPNETKAELNIRFSLAMTFLDKLYKRDSDVEYIVDGCIYMALCKCDDICKIAEHLVDFEMVLALHSLGEHNIEFKQILEHEFDPLRDLREMLDDIRSEFENEFNRILLDIEFVERSGEIFMLLKKLAPLQINLGYLPISLGPKIYILEKFHEFKINLEKDMLTLIREMYGALHTSNAFDLEVPIEFSVYSNSILNDFNMFAAPHVMAELQDEGSVDTESLSD